MSSRKPGFENLSPTTQFGPGFTIWDALKAQMHKPANLRPSRPLPCRKTNLKEYYSKEPSVVWLGHSSYLIHQDGTNILVDPVLSGSAAPVPWMVKAFPADNAYRATDMPAIDYMVITHNHYDHLDFRTVKALLPRTAHFVLPAGVSRELMGLGIGGKEVSELSWDDAVQLSPRLKVTATPARHFSGRGLRRNGTLWNSYVLELDDKRLFLGGDSGYDSHFADIGKDYGPFDLAILECGQYNEMWPYIHSFPEQLIVEARELNARCVLPVHWAKFALALHAWDEPIKRFTAAAGTAGLPYTTPRIGEPVILGESYPQDRWWEE